MSNPRHAAPSRTAVLAGRVAVGVVGAPVALLAVAGPASAAALDDNRLSADLAADSFSVDGEMSEASLPEPGTAGAGGLPAGDAFDLAALPGLPALPGADGLPELPGADSLPGTNALPALPGADSLPGAEALPEIPLSAAMDLDADSDDLESDAGTLPSADLFSATDLVSGIV